MTRSAKPHLPRGTAIADRLMYHSDRSGSCWIWTASITSEGYGQLGIGNRVLRAHRVSYETFVGPIPEGMTVDHLCHNAAVCEGGRDCPHRRCMNPTHLGLATRGGNALRAIRERQGRAA